MSKTVLVLVETVDDYLPLLERAGYRLIRAPSPQMRADAITRHAGEIDAVLTRGPLGLTANEIATLTQLQIICVIGAGYEQVDLEAAAARGITVTNGAGANAGPVADHAMALLVRARQIDPENSRANQLIRHLKQLARERKIENAFNIDPAAPEAENTPSPKSSA